MLSSVLRYYDEAVLNYYSTIQFDDGKETRNAQTVLAIPSRKGAELLLSNEVTPVLPMIVVTRQEITPTPETFLIKNQITRPHILNLNENKNVYDGIEVMPYNMKYQLDFYSLQQQVHNIILEQLLFLTYKKAYIKTLIEINIHQIEVNAYIKDINYSDSTTYVQITDQSTRIFHGVISFTLCGFLYNDKRAVSTVKEINNSISSTNEILQEIKIEEELN